VRPLMAATTAVRGGGGGGGGGGGHGRVGLGQQVAERTAQGAKVQVLYGRPPVTRRGRRRHEARLVGAAVLLPGVGCRRVCGRLWVTVQVGMGRGGGGATGGVLYVV